MAAEEHWQTRVSSQATIPIMLLVCRVPLIILIISIVTIVAAATAALPPEMN